MNATIRVSSVQLDCPKCGEGMPAPDNGSYLWPITELHELPKTVTCPACRQRLTVPTKALERMAG